MDYILKTNGHFTTIFESFQIFTKCFSKFWDHGATTSGWNYMEWPLQYYMYSIVWGL